MRILHLDLCDEFTENMTYQENLLSEAMQEDGHEVFVISTCYTYDNGVLIKVKPEEKILRNGVTLIRLEYKKYFCEFISRKLRVAKGLYKKIEEISPDIIIFHGLQSLSASTVCKYAEINNVPLVADIHGDYNNTANTFLSKYFLHRIVYKIPAKQLEKTAKKIYYITTESEDLAIQEYGTKKENMKFLPLGGRILSEDLYNEFRLKKREELGLNNEDVLIVQAGKLDRLKKPDLLIEAYIEACPRDSKLVFIGSMDKELEDILIQKIQGAPNTVSIDYIGWKSGDELIQYLCATDLYIQPGGMSAILQNAICNKCAVIVYPHKAYQKGYIEGNGSFAKDKTEIIEAIKDICENPNKLEEMKEQSDKIAREQLDYIVQGRMIISDCMG